VEMVGLDSHNPTVKGLTANDIQDIEAIFVESKIRGIQSLRGRPGGRPATAGDITIEDIENQLLDDISCCCCTPCCTCAAADVDPFESGIPDEA
jgi:hypothetical protein